jgi:hypothetical protein
MQSQKTNVSHVSPYTEDLCHTPQYLLYTLENNALSSLLKLLRNHAYTGLVDMVHHYFMQLL